MIKAKDHQCWLSLSCIKNIASFSLTEENMNVGKDIELEEHFTIGTKFKIFKLIYPKSHSNSEVPPND